MSSIFGQLNLFGTEASEHARPWHRVSLDADCWVEVWLAWLAPGPAQSLFERLSVAAPWEQNHRVMFDRYLAEPRLRCWFDRASANLVEPTMLGMFVELSERYCVEFDTAGLNLYRDGSDSVAWHGDRIESRAQEPVVAIVSLGNPRPFRMRPRGGGRSATWVLQPGDLFVMGGACQQHFDHSVPKIRTCGPRISVTFRHGDGPTIRGRRYSSPASTDVKAPSS